MTFKQENLTGYYGQLCACTCMGKRAETSAQIDKNARVIYVIFILHANRKITHVLLCLMAHQNDMQHVGMEICRHEIVFVMVPNVQRCQTCTRTENAHSNTKIHTDMRAHKHAQTNTHT